MNIMNSISDKDRTFICHRCGATFTLSPEEINCHMMARNFKPIIIAYEGICPGCNTLNYNVRNLDEESDK